MEPRDGEIDTSCVYHAGKPRVSPTPVARPPPTSSVPGDTQEIERGRLRSADDRLDRSVLISDENSCHRDASAGTSEHLATFGAGTITLGLSWVSCCIRFRIPAANNSALYVT